MKRGKLSEQVKAKVEKVKDHAVTVGIEYDGSNDIVVSTGSTLLDLAISGGRFPRGGIPAGILVEIFGPPSTGKTVLLSQIAANIQRAGGKVMFHDPEARLNKQFARLFGLDVESIEYTMPNTVTEVFRSVRDWIAKTKDEPAPLYGVIADSLAALSTDMEMEAEEGDKMGMRRAKEFSEQLRRTCRLIKQHNVLMVCSNQVRQNLDAGPYGLKYRSPGGEAVGFYASLRLRCMNPQKIKVTRTINGKEHERVVGVQVEVEVFKSSVWKPYRVAEVYILYDYGIDDIRANLKFLKTVCNTPDYRIGDMVLGKGLDRAIRKVEEDGLEEMLKERVVKQWREIEAQFSEPRKPRQW